MCVGVLNFLFVYKSLKYLAISQSSSSGGISVLDVKGEGERKKEALIPYFCKDVISFHTFVSHHIIIIIYYLA